MTYNKKVSFGKVAGVSLLSFVMMFAAAAPSMTQAYAVPFDGDISKGVIDFGNADPECFSGITIVKPTGTTCQFFIIYSGDLAIVEDTVPAEWEVLSIEPFAGLGNCTTEVKNPGKSATKITCDETDFLIQIITVETRESPGNKNPNKADKFKPTSCGDLVLNDGAVAFASEAGEKILVDDGQGIGILVPIVIDASAPLVLTAVNPDDPDCIGLPEPDDD